MECAHNYMDTSVCLFNMLFSDWIIQLHYFFYVHVWLYSVNMFPFLFMCRESGYVLDTLSFHLAFFMQNMHKKLHDRKLASEVRVTQQGILQYISGHYILGLRE